MPTQAECEKALEAWTNQYAGVYDDELGGGKYLRGDSGVFTNINAVINRKRLPKHLTAAEVLAQPLPTRPKTRGPAAKKRNVPEANQGSGAAANVPTPRRPRRTASKKENTKPVVPPKGSAPSTPKPTAAVHATAPSTVSSYIKPLGATTGLASHITTESVTAHATAAAAVAVRLSSAASSVGSDSLDKEAERSASRSTTGEVAAAPAFLLPNPILPGQMSNTQLQQLQQMQQLMQMQQYMALMQPGHLQMPMMHGLMSQFAASAAPAISEFDRMEAARARLNLEEVERQALLNARLRYEMSLKR